MLVFISKGTRKGLCYQNSSTLSFMFSSIVLYLFSCNQFFSNNIIRFTFVGCYEKRVRFKFLFRRKFQEQMQNEWIWWYLSFEMFSIKSRKHINTTTGHRYEASVFVHKLCLNKHQQIQLNVYNLCMVNLFHSPPCFQQSRENSLGMEENGEILCFSDLFVQG